MESSKARLSPLDPSSYSRPDEVKVLDTFLQLLVNFESHVLEGSATLSLEKVLPGASILCLDSRNLSITSVSSLIDGSPLAFNTTRNLTSRGKPKSFKIQIQTAGKTHPYMFSQCQAIHARSMMPCQDTPSIKSTYSAEITAPTELTVLMSAVRGEEKLVSRKGRELKVTSFLQKIPIQSYLVAIVAGRLESRELGPRSKVWAEAEYVERAAADFEDTETMIATAEEICGPYIWGVYDVLVLPPSFPFGGMENPCLTFVTPTLLTGDKSLTDVIAHEIAHSWSGNLVTNSNFEHFWLNEGFTMFIERKIKGRIEKSEPLRHFEGIGGWKRLAYGIEVLGADNPLTDLVPDLSGVDPDDAFSVVPYEKGFVLLWYLEERVGGPSVFDPFLKGYIQHFKFQSIDSSTFKNYFMEHFPQLEGSISWDEWFHKPGMPIYKPNYDTSLSKACEALKDKVLSGDISTEYSSLTVGQKIEFLHLLMEEKSGLPLDILEKMKSAYGLGTITNSEIKFLWIRLGLKSQWREAVGMAVSMLKEQGRMKFTRPLYRDLYAWEETRDLALKTFQADRPNMMLVSIQGVEKDLKLR
ncbi:Leukotriene A4 hydrolaselike [Caligus rogercresseyi]|uniref:Leukotriene A4 hydrolaselike n=1 Tax=Caligus rogercresseyi TaxID=217165 RepID=A0A7T8GM10_CALRO|nr:Leukotriene A4 hydrolaselike [Caligus rogercresseyi]QQP32961.1 Leukotriene A4 hydrolaselike [Caligus rogercresseyi]